MNKRRIATFLVLLFICFSLSSYAASAVSSPYTVKEKVFLLPSSLKEIRDEAFEGTAVETVVFREGLLRIEESVFKNAFNLKDVFIPVSTEYIGDQAFPTCSNYVIHGVKGSYAEKWAENAQISFDIANIWNTINTIEQFMGTYKGSTNYINHNIYSEKESKLFPRTEDEGRSMRPQERTELNPIDYRFP